MTADNGNVDTFKGDPVGPGTPAWEAGNDARDALVHCFKQVQPHIKREDLDLTLDQWVEGITGEALEDFKREVGISL